jgi:hypothetical protein
MHQWKLFVLSIWRDWGARMCGPLTIPLTIAAFYVKADWQKALWSLAAIISLIYTSYRVWVNEHKAYVEAEKRIGDLSEKLISQRPDFLLETGNACGQYDQGAGHTIVYVRVNILNRGADSVALRWKAEYCSGTDRQPARVRNLFSRQSFMPLGNGRNLKITNDDLMTTKTIKPIVRGTVVAGRLLITVPGDKLDDLKTGRGLFIITCVDYLGREYSVEAKKRGVTDPTEPEFSPDETVYYDDPGQDDL